MSKFDIVTWYSYPEKLYYQNEREIKAKAEITYGAPEYTDNSNTAITFDETSLNIAPLNGINMSYITDTTFDDISEEFILNTKDATLENNYIRLDGNHYFLDKNNDVGYISNILTNPYSTHFTFNIDIDNTKISGKTSGITLYFDENIPSHIKVKTVSGNTRINVEVTDNNSEIASIDFGEEVEFTQANRLYILCSNWSSTTHRIRLKRVKLGLTKIYDSNDIVSMNISETTKKICTEIPEDECSIVLNNTNDDFDILNPEGITSHLNKNTIVKPYIGISDGNETIYKCMGKFYLDTWTNNNDNTTTLNFKNEVIILKDINLEPQTDYVNDKSGCSIIQNYVYREQMNNTLYSILKNYGLKMLYYRDGDDYEGKWKISSWGNKQTKLLDYIQQLAVASGNIVKYDKYNFMMTIVPTYFDEYEENPYYVDYIDENDYLEEPVITKTDKINKVRFIRERTDNNLDTNYNNQMNLSFTTTIPNQIVRIDLDGPCDIDPLVKSMYEYGGSSTYWIMEDDNNNTQLNSYMLFMVLRGNPGTYDNITISTKSLSKTDEVIEFDDIQGEEAENILEINSDFLLVDGQELQKMAQYYMDYSGKYDMKFEYEGNPYREVGDIIRVKTKYGEKDIFIEKLNYKYDGGLTCDVEGVDINGS